MFDEIYSPKWLLRRPAYGYLLGLVFSIFGIFSARLIFGINSGYMGVSFTSILLIASLTKMLKIVEKKKVRTRKISFRLFTDYREIFLVYFYLFFGIFTSYAIFSLFWSDAYTMHIFGPQLKVAGIMGSAISKADLGTIITNNLIVLFVCFLLSFFYGASSIIFLGWNASAWGAVFGYIARQSTGGHSPLIGFGLMMLPILPHMITEAVSYFSASIVGGVVSTATMNESWMSKRFRYVVGDSLILMGYAIGLMTLAAVIEVYVFS